MLRKLEAVERALYQNSKVVVPSDTQLVNVIGDLAGLEAQATDGAVMSKTKPLAEHATRRGNGAGSSVPSPS
jgi:hypothetical protein